MEQIRPISTEKPKSSSTLVRHLFQHIKSKRLIFIDIDRDDVLDDFQWYDGDREGLNSVWDYTYWPHALFNKISASEEPESRCAKRCLIQELDDCHFYYFAEGYCMLGRYTAFGRQRDYFEGDNNETTRYMQRKDLGKSLSWHSGECLSRSH